MDYFENSLPHRIFATCLETKILPTPTTKGRKARVNCKCKYEQKRNEVRWRQRLDVSDSGRTSFPLLTQEDKKRLCLQAGMERVSRLSRTMQGNPESWAWEYKLQLKESGIPLKFGVRNPSFTDKESGIQFMESRIHSLESRIHDCLGFSYMGWLTFSKFGFNLNVHLTPVHFV